MANELPYLKFYVAAWLLGRISHEKDTIKGRFADAFSHYWHKECVITPIELEKKMGKSRLNSLIKLEYIKVKSGLISIPFLDEQWGELSGLKAKRSAAGTKGRQAQLGQTPGKQNNLPGHLEQNRTDKNRTEESYTASPEQTNFLRVGRDRFDVTPSDYFKSANQITFEQWKMKNPHDASYVEKVFKKMDDEYNGYDFTDDNHVKRTFFSLLEKVKGSPAKNQNLPVSNTLPGSFYKNK